MKQIVFRSFSNMIGVGKRGEKLRFVQASYPPNVVSVTP